MALFDDDKGDLGAALVSPPQPPFPQPVPPGATQPPGVPPTALARPPQADPRILYQQRDQLQARLTSLQDQLAEIERTGNARYDAAMRPVEQSEMADWQALADIRKKYMDQPREALPEWKPTPVVNAQDYQKFSLALVAIALFGGLRGQWQGATASLNGAMEGYLEGSEEKAKRNWQEFQQQYTKALDSQRAQQKEMEDALKAADQSINMRLRQEQILAARHQREDIAQAAGVQHSIDQVQRQLEASAEAIARLEESNSRVASGFDIGLRKLSGGAFNVRLTDQAAQVAGYLDQISGKPGSFTSKIVGRFSSQQEIPIFNGMVDRYMQQHPGAGPEEYARYLVQNSAELKGIESAYTMNKRREAGVLRLTMAIQGMEQKVLELAKQVVPTGVPVINARVNDIKIKFGDAGIAALRNMILATAREYIEAVTMPGSNAQLHATAQTTADEMINSNMSVGQMMAAFYAMNQEIDSTSGALSTISQHLLQEIGSKYGAKDLQPDMRNRISGEMADKSLDWNSLPSQ
jgi:hypothetical protein